MSENTNQDNVFITIKDLWILIRRNWYWFFISVIVAVTVAVGYIAITPPTFTRTASILVKDNASKGQSATDPLKELGLYSPNTDIKSEMYILKSPSLMETVVRRLKLDVNYSIKFKSIRKVDLYNNTPILVELDSTLQECPISFEITLLPSRKVSISNITGNKAISDKEIKGNISETINTPYGGIKINPTAVYSEISNSKIIYFTKSKLSKVVKACSKALNIVCDEDNAPILWLSYVDVNPQRAEDVLNTIISIYKENWIKDRNQVTQNTSEFIDERLNVIEAELGGVDQNISSYKSANLLPDIGAVGSMYLAQSNSNKSQQTTLQNQLSMARYIRSCMNEATSISQLIPANTGVENANIESQIDKYNTLLLQKNNLLANSSEQNPVVGDMIKSLVAMRNVIIRSTDDYISTLNIQIDNIRKEDKNTNQKLASNPNQAKYLLSVERQQKVKEALYLLLLQKREENELSQTFSAYNTKVINAPDGNMTPTAPRKNVILLAALVIGLLLPTMVLIVLQSLDTLVRSRSDLNSLTIPFLGDIPQLSKKRHGLKKNNEEQSGKIVVSDKNRNVINEAFRNLRNNIDFMHSKSDIGTVIMTTSFFPGSGKSFISSNIALSMAVKGACTVIIDIDLRKATLSKLVGSPKKGLSDFLASKIDTIEQVIVKSEQNPNLDVIPAGKIPPNPSELVLDSRFAELIADLRTKYDYIFLDCPPVEIVSETAVIGKVCDMTLFIIRVGIFDKRMLPEIEEFYKSRRYNNMGIVLNGVEYGYGKYGYGKYGYGNDIEEAEYTVNNL